MATMPAQNLIGGNLATPGAPGNFTSSQIAPALLQSQGPEQLPNVRIGAYTPGLRAWKWAVFGDSRVNFSSATGPDISVSTSGNTPLRTPTWLQAFLGDAEFTRSYAVSGDTASNWLNASRTGGRTIYDLVASDIDAVYIQYGVNDAMAQTPAITIVGYLQALCLEIMKSGKYVVFEAINPIRSPATSFVSTQAIIDSVNALMSAWLVNFRPNAIFIDTASALKDNSGFANPTYYNVDGIHFVQAGAYVAGKLISAAVRGMIPQRGGAFISPSNAQPNLLSVSLPAVFSLDATGTATAINQTSGQDSSGPYLDFVYTPTSLAGGVQQKNIYLAANFQSSNPPYYSLRGNEILQGYCKLILDDGNGGSPAAMEIAVRQRFYTASIFSDALQTGVVSVGAANFTEAVNISAITPRLINSAASVDAAPASGTGYNLQFIIRAQQTGASIRLRVYYPSLRIVGYSAPIAVTPGASPYTYTNNSTGNQFVYVAGGTVSSITQNGVATGLTSGIFPLAPNDTLTVTYSVAPTTFTIKQM